MAIDVNLSAHVLAILAVVVDRNGDATLQTLRESIDPCTFSVEASDLVDGLQLLLDRDLVFRRGDKKRYVYVPSPAGTAVLRAWIHPAGNTLESLA